MRLSLFNAFATPVVFGAQRPVARAVRFGDDKQDVKAADTEGDDADRNFWVDADSNWLQRDLARKLEEAAGHNGETAGEVDDDNDT